MDLLKQNITSAIPENIVNDLQKALKEKKITLSDIKLIALSELQQCYNSIKSHLWGIYLENPDNIIYRNHIYNYLEREESYNRNIYKSFDVLKNIGYIGVCGRGFTFENPKIELSEDQYNRLTKVLFEILA